jgi:hypothetical protein
MMRKPSTREDSEDEEKPEEPQTIIGPVPCLDTKHRYFIGKDYSNPYEKDFDTLEKYSEGIFNHFNFPIFSLALFIKNRFYRSKSSTPYAMA